jgi:tRNA nucleotidyltransferase (CCA-adding enzyme)
MKAFIVGGWVRDKILGIISQDKDWVVVGATPEDLLCQNFKQVGASFPVFLHPLTQEEYALARTERKTGSGYHGFSVSFDKTVTLEEDLLRRDLSINAIAFDVDNEIYVDPFGGIQDLENKVLRHVSDAFSEDPLRVVRLARFHSLFADFSIDQNLLQLVEKMIADSLLKELAKERSSTSDRNFLETLF